MVVIVDDDGENIFSGIVETEEVEIDKQKYVKVTSIDYSRLIDKRLVFTTFVSELAGDIVKDLITNFFA
jgi:hypothetical protein